MPRITIGFIVVALILYVVGARYPMLAQRVGLA
jgi:hypothetical protein